MTDASEQSRSFGSIAPDYDRFRSSPPDAAVAWLLPGHAELLVDVGAGTGLFTRALAGRARRIVAVEPDDRMRAVLAARSPGIDVLAGRGESIPLPDASVDGVFVSSAWHWMDAERASAEVARILRTGGRFGVIWTGRDRDSDWLRADDWFAEAVADDPNRGVPAAERNRRRETSLPAGGPFMNIETQTFLFTRPMSPVDLVEMLATYSRIITAPPPAQELGRARASAALAELFPGAASIDVPMRSRCWRADRGPRNAAG